MKRFWKEKKKRNHDRTTRGPTEAVMKEEEEVDVTATQRVTEVYDVRIT